MTDLTPVNIKVNVDATGVASGVATVSNGLNNLKAQATSTASAFGSFKQLALGMFAGNILTTGLMGITAELRAMKQETIDLQVAGTRLEGALSGIGITSESTKKQVYNLADSYYQLGFQGSEAIGAMGTLVTATGDVEQATKLMSMSADLARYKHISMTTAATTLARGTQGSARAFKELGITLDTTIPKNQAIAKAFDELNAKIGGQAQAYTKTFAGQMDILKERLDNVAQSIGATVLPVLSKMLEFITKNGKAILIYGAIVLGVVASIKAYRLALIALNVVQAIQIQLSLASASGIGLMRAAMLLFNDAVKANPVGFLVTAVLALGAAFVFAWNKFEGFRNAVVKGIQIIVNGIGYVVGGVSTLIKALSYVPGMGGLKAVSKEVDKVADSIRKYSDGLDSLANKKINTPKIPGFVAPGSNTGIVGNVPGGDTSKTSDGGGSGSQTVQYVTVYASNTNDIAKKLSRAAKNGIPVGGR